MTRSSSHACNEWTAITQEEKMEDVQITQSTNDNLVEQRNVTMDASLLLWHGLCHHRDFCSILYCYPMGPEPQTQRLLLFSKINWGCWTQQSSWETFCLRGWMLSLNFVSHCASHHTIGLVHTGTCWQEWCVRLHRDKLRNRGRSVW